MRSGYASACAIGVRMSGCPELRQHRAVNVLDQRMDDALRMDDDLDRRRAATPNSQCASITSRPLFIIVAESTEILRPIDQLGCAHASSGVTCGKLGERARAERPARRGEQDAPNAARGRDRAS